MATKMAAEMRFIKKFYICVKSVLYKVFLKVDSDRECIAVKYSE